MYFEKEWIKQVFIQKDFLAFIVKKGGYYFRRYHHCLEIKMNQMVMAID
jgi:hypothetical protein